MGRLPEYANKQSYGRSDAVVWTIDDPAQVPDLHKPDKSTHIATVAIVERTGPPPVPAATMSAPGVTTYRGQVETYFLSETPRRPGQAPNTEIKTHVLYSRNFSAGSREAAAGALRKVLDTNKTHEAMEKIPKK